ncbi:MAG: family 10 glycosylhydrolase, partial [Bacteroidales bacterium]|nr:family 10 glycosylhydrolase [Bacteroidales bacterium]
MPKFNSYFVNSGSIQSVLFLILSFFMLNTYGQQEADNPWYADKLLRIYHPNMRNWEVTGFDVEKFVNDCVSVNAEAIVVNAGGIYSYYPSKIEYHNPNSLLGGRDLFGEICEEAKKRDLKIIARFDFAGATTELSELYPEWFHTNKDGSFESHRGTQSRFSTTPTGGYHNVELAHKVLLELIDKYEISGIHLNGPVFDGISYYRVSMDKYGSFLQGDMYSNPEMAHEFNSWRQSVVEGMILDYRRILHKKDENILIMAEIAGAESPGWAYNKGFDNYRLSHAFTNLLLTTGRMSEGLYRFRYWIGLSAEMAHAARPDFPPIINLKVPTYGYTDFQKPVEEYKYYCYQAIAHNAGLKLPTYGMLQTQKDTRSKEMVSSIFTYMKRREEFAVNPKKI